ncbi:hypothetical protein RISK_002155 [Rhodopirellula islandica]|uniref:Uncharacterized protein n=1 Tax=Rhodopirellula islandica TaxID=595434 RepID=A0A0J1BG61_RHOIS|nr:hypothetical protein RISK_002155 [Rhodopirellula islandica]
MRSDASHGMDEVMTVHGSKLDDRIVLADSGLRWAKRQVSQCNGEVAVSVLPRHWATEEIEPTPTGRKRELVPIKSENWE